MSDSDYQRLEPKEKSLEQINSEIELNKLKELFEMTEPNHPGAKFRRIFEDMKGDDETWQQQHQLKSE